MLVSGLVGAAIGSVVTVASPKVFNAVKAKIAAIKAKAIADVKKVA